MAKERMKVPITSFTSDGDYLAILSLDGIVKILNTNDGTILGEWKQSEVDSDAKFSCLACSFIGKKRRKAQVAFIVALGTESGDIFAIDALTGELRWKAAGCHPGGIANIAFAKKGRIMRTVGLKGMTSEISSETGELMREFKISKRSISSSSFTHDEKILAAAGNKIQVLDLESGTELLKFSVDMGPVQFISLSEDGKLMITSGFGEKNLQLWQCDLTNKTVGSGPTLSMGRPPLAIECKKSCIREDDLVVLSVSESGVVYLWMVKNISGEADLKTSKITVSMKEPHTIGSSRKSRASIIAARLLALEADEPVRILIAYSFLDSLRFSLLDISPGEDIVVTPGDEAGKSVATVQENGVHAEEDLHEEAEGLTTPIHKGKSSKKRAASDQDTTNLGTLEDNVHEEPIDGAIGDDLNEPTMGEKLASLSLASTEFKSLEKADSSPNAKPPSADSIHVLLKQALHADDRALLTDCLFRQDEKVIEKSISRLNPSDVLKLLESLVSIIQSRGAVLFCALPWLRSLLLQHASGIMSQESSLRVLNSLYQLIESRVSTFQTAIQLSSCLDLLYAGSIEGVEDENDTQIPVIFEDKDESDEEESEDAMDTDEDSKPIEAFSDVSDVEVGDDDMGY